MSLISERFALAERENRALLIGYLTAGFPTLQRCKSAIAAMIEGGVDLIEVGFPYSDPVMDGPVIQRASELAIENGVGAREVFEVVSSSSVPTHNTQYTIHNTQYHNTHYHNTEYTIHNTQYTIHNTQYTIPQYTIPQYTIHNTQYTIHNTRYQQANQTQQIQKAQHQQQPKVTQQVGPDPVPTGFQCFPKVHRATGRQRYRQRPKQEKIKHRHPFHNCKYDKEHLQ